MKKGKGRNSNLLPNSLRIISSCIKTLSTNASTAVRSAGASVAASISSSGDDNKEQVLWAGFDKLDLSPARCRRVLLLGYLKGFQIFDVEDASGFNELVSRRDGPVTFLQMLPSPANCDAAEISGSSHPILVVVGGNEDERTTLFRSMGQVTGRYGSVDSSSGSPFEPPTAVRFYSMKLNEYVKVIDFKSAVYAVRCCPRVVAIVLEEQVYCFDALTLEKKFMVVTYPVPREQGAFGIRSGYGPIALGPRWLAYPPNRPFLLNTGRVVPKSLASTVGPSTYPGRGSLMARYAMESSKHLAAGILTLGDAGYKKLSQYCPELLPDAPSSPGWKARKLAGSEPDNAGVIAVKDLISLEVISQFRAHTSPISALSFDPTGTLLVTASVYGNNFNIFRIMPSRTCNGLNSGDWSDSYVHLYKLHRGFTSAVIQDICFSQYSQWVAFVSAKGTCHIYTLCPFGGDKGFQTLQNHRQKPSLVLATSQPWWSTSSFAINEQNLSPPPLCALSVVARIKCSDSGLLNSVSYAASSMAGKIWVPSGAFAAIFHNANPAGSLDVHSSGSPLEHILVYTPSGFVVQYEIQLSVGQEPSENRTGSLSASQVNPLNEELGIKVEPTQWWDVCRRQNNLEREECISGLFHGQNDPEIDDDSEKNFLESPSSGEKNLLKNDSLKSLERSHLYLSNAELQIDSCRLPMWQKSKMHFHGMEQLNENCNFGGEFEIETASSHEVEIRHKYLLPIFDHFPSARSHGKDRSIPSDGIYPAKEKSSEARSISHSKPESFSYSERSEGGSSSRAENLLNLDHMNINIPPTVSVETHQASLTDQRTEKTADFDQFFKEGYYCNNPDVDNHRKSTEAVADEVDNGGNNNLKEEDEKPDEEGITGGLFDFCLEG